MRSTVAGKFSVFLIMTSVVFGSAFSKADDPTPKESNQPDSVSSQQITEVTAEAERSATVVKIGNREYRVPSEPTLAEFKYNYSLIGQQAQAQFLERRALWLKAAASALHFSKWAYGVGVIANRTFTFKKHADPLPTVREAQHQMVERLLVGINDQLWLQAPVIAKSNEYGMNLSALLIGGGSMGTKGLGGMIEIGITLGFNVSTQSLVFQIYKTNHKFRNGLVFNAALGLNLGVYQANYRHFGAEKLVEKGFMASPPIPFPPTYFQVTSERMILGMNPVVGLVPTPFDGMFTYTTAIQQKTLLRLETYSLNRLIKMDDWDVEKDMKFAYSTVRDYIDLIRRYMLRAPRCHSALL